jgi:hypothetical protein
LFLHCTIVQCYAIQCASLYTYKTVLFWFPKDAKRYVRKFNIFNNCNCDRCVCVFSFYPSIQNFVSITFIPNKFLIIQYDEFCTPTSWFNFLKHSKRLLIVIGNTWNGLRMYYAVIEIHLNQFFSYSAQLWAEMFGRPCNIGDARTLYVRCVCKNLFS